MIKVYKTKILLFALLIMWMIFIFIMSSQSADDSSQLSGGIVSRIIAAFCCNFDSLTQKQQINIVDIVTFLIRKAAHFSEYFILGLLSSLVALTYKRYEYKVMILSFVFCVLYATSDEIHQYFVPGRACRFADICIDAAGSATAIIILTVIFYYKKRQKSGELNAKKETDRTKFILV